MIPSKPHWPFPRRRTEEQETSTLSALWEFITRSGLRSTAMRYAGHFLVLLVVFIALMIWLLPKIWRGIRKIFAWFGNRAANRDTREQDEAAPADGQPRS